MPIDPTPGSGNEPFDHFVLALVETCVAENVHYKLLLAIVLGTIRRAQGEAVAALWVDKLKAMMPS